MPWPNMGGPCVSRTCWTRAPTPRPRSTVWCRPLTQGMLSFDPERQTYTPGLRLVRLAHAAWQASSLAPIARPHLDDLSRTTGETVHLAQLDGGQVLYVDKRNAADPVEMYSQAGKVGPAYCTGVGKAMLAHLPEAELAPVLQRRPGIPSPPRRSRMRTPCERSWPRSARAATPSTMKNTSRGSSVSQCRSGPARAVCWVHCRDIDNRAHGPGRPFGASARHRARRCSHRRRSAGLALPRSGGGMRTGEGGRGHVGPAR
jgi:hypothetical protein